MSIKVDALGRASSILGEALTKVLTSDPHEAAVKAFIPKVTPSVVELEAQIRRMQADNLKAARAA